MKPVVRHEAVGGIATLSFWILLTHRDVALSLYMLKKICDSTSSTANWVLKEFKASLDNTGLVILDSDPYVSISTHVSTWHQAHFVCYFTSAEYRVQCH